jgi:hypothetical protein
LNEHQYRQLCDNRRRASPALLGAAGGRGTIRGRSPLAAVLAAATRAARRRQKAALAWQRIAQPEWLVGAAVEAVEGDTLVVAVDSPALGCELRRRAAALAGDLAGLVPGLVRVRFVMRSALHEGGA